MFTAWRRIQKIIQVSTATAENIAMPSKICSERPSSSPTVKKRSAPVMTDARTAAAVPAQTTRICSRLSVFARKARTMPTMSEASSPSRVVRRAAPMRGSSPLDGSL